jgi:hypothetical protein
MLSFYDGLVKRRPNERPIPSLSCRMIMVRQKAEEEALVVVVVAVDNHSNR